MKRNKLVTLLLTFLLVFSLAACGQTDSDSSESQTSEQAESSVEETSTEEESMGEEEVVSDGEVVSTEMVPGTYDVTMNGYGGEMTVSVTVDEKLITDISIESLETEGIGSVAVEKVPERIIEHQSLAVDGITGATASSAVVKAAVGKAIDEAGGNAQEWKDRVVEKNTDPIEETADVIVVGGGGAGLAAAVEAADNGATVILVEKTGALGGNTVRSGGQYNAVDPERQANVEAQSQQAMDGLYELTEAEAQSPRHQELMDTLKAELDEYAAGPQDKLFDSITLHTLQTYAGGDYVADLAFIEILTQRSLEALNWMADNGVVWVDEVGTVPGGMWPRAHLPQNSAGVDFINASLARAEEMGVVIYYDIAAEELIVEDGKVVGVKGTSADGAEATFHAESGVVLATGGFAANKEMRQEYDANLTPELGTTNSPAITGDGIRMAQEVGAATTGMEYIQSLPLGDPKSGSLGGWLGSEGVGQYYQVNTEGKRFMAEDGRRDYMTQELLKQEGAMSYVITDQTSVHEGNMTLWGDHVDELIQQKRIFKADTIEELAEQLEMDPAVLQKTHDDFNSYVEAGEDPEFGRTLFTDKIDQGPYYASPRMPTVHHTMGGLQIDGDARVLDTDGNPIPGLYAAGEVTGGIHGSNRLGGNALVDIHVFGRIAGQSAAEGK